MGGGVLGRDRPVVAARHDAPADDQHGADRHLALALGGGGLAQTFAHQLDIARADGRVAHAASVRRSNRG
jgi:hypothetical protein